MRLVFRVVFIASFLLLGLDWTREVHPLTTNAFWTDVLGLFGSIGYVSSSVLTLPVRDVLSESVTSVRLFTIGAFTDLLPSTNESPIKATHQHSRELDH